MADTLPEMLQALFQFRGAESEVIVVDDGSTDHVERVIGEFEARAERSKDLSLRNLRIPNRGRAGAINRGVGEAEGEFIAFADADDVVDVEEFQKMWNCCTLHKPDMAVGSFSIESAGRVSPEVRTIQAGTTNLELIRKLAYSPLAPIHLNAVLIRRELFLHLGGFDESLIRAQDKDLTLRLLKETGNIVICDAVPYIYRRHGSGVRERIGKRLEWLVYRQKVLRKHFGGVELVAAVSSQFIFDLLKLMVELFKLNQRDK